MNELQIKPARTYEVYTSDEGQVSVDKFEADDRKFDVVENSLKFFRTGNLIREYFNPFATVRKVVATPVDA